MNAPPRTHRRLLVALAAALTLAAILIGLPLLAAALGGLPHQLPTWSQVQASMRRRDNGAGYFKIAAFVIIWIAWAYYLLATVRETAASIRARGPRRPPASSSGAARTFALVSPRVLVAAIALLFVAAPTVLGYHATPAAASPGGHASPAPPARVAARHTPEHPPRSPVPQPDTTTTRADANARERLPRYQVQRYDTLLRIAAEHLPGNAARRYRDIKALNPDHVGPDNEIITGATLVLPTDAIGHGIIHPSSADGDATQTVRAAAGDTLWDIEQDVTGNGSNWVQGWEANRGRAEPGGEHFTDPNQIQPGWTFDIPIAHRHAPPQDRTHTPDHPRQHTAPRPPHTETPLPPRSDPAQPTPTHPAPPATLTHPPAQTGDHPAAPTTRAGAARSDNRYLEITIGAGLLAGCTITALAVLRRRKSHRRAAGRVVAQLPVEYAGLEEALRTAGRAALPGMAFLDLALRDLTRRAAHDPARSLPDIEGAVLGEDRLELLLSAPHTAPPEPWVALVPTRWALSRDIDLPEEAAAFAAPYPCLVSVGHAVDGSEYLLDLEHVGALRLAGEPRRCLDLARYMIAELANNVWSDHLTVTIAGFGQDLTAANPTRIVTAADARDAADMMRTIAQRNRDAGESQHVDVLTGRATGTAADLWMPQLLIAAPGLLDADLEQFAAATGGGRTAVAVVLAGGQGETPVAELGVTETGALRLPGQQVGPLTAMALSADTAGEMAQAIALERDGVIDVAAPPTTREEPWAEYTSATGALLSAHTLPRAAALDPTDIGRDSPSSLLPSPDEVYLESGMTTAEELAALAPAVSAQTRRAVERRDGDLDLLVESWFDTGLKIARLHLLGPVSLTAFGAKPDGSDQCLEAITYLKRKPHGVTLQQFADALWPDREYDVVRSSYPRTVASRARTWLGVDPRTGEEYLSRANTPGEWTLKIRGLIEDEELFTRLYRRGQARGEDGVADLITALRLVTGEPYSRRRRDWEKWWRPADASTQTSAVQDVAAAVATSALAEGNHDQAIWACDVSLSVDPDNDLALGRKAWAYELAGHEAEKDAIVLQLKSRNDDMDRRTLEMMRRRGWLAHGA